RVMKTLSKLIIAISLALAIPISALADRLVFDAQKKTLLPWGQTSTSTSRSTLPYGSVSTIVNTDNAVLAYAFPYGVLGSYQSNLQLAMLKLPACGANSDIN